MGPGLGYRDFDICDLPSPLESRRAKHALLYHNFMFLLALIPSFWIMGFFSLI